MSCIDDFCQRITNKTVLVMDNSSVHQNNLLSNKEEEWAKKGLKIFFLPTYSPQLNIIEILWRFIKYQWLEIEAYENYSKLVDCVENILINVGVNIQLILHDYLQVCINLESGYGNSISKILLQEVYSIILG